MKTTITFLLLFSIFILALPASARNADLGRLQVDSFIYPSVFSTELLVGESSRPYSLYSLKGGFRYEFRRKSRFGFVTGANLILGNTAGFGIPLLLSTSLNDARGSDFKLSAGVIMQAGGQPLFYPSIDLRCRARMGKRGFFVDLVLHNHWYYKYDCPRSNLTCQGKSYRVGWKNQWLYGIALGRAKPTRLKKKYL